MTDQEKKAIEIEDSISILENTDLDINNIYSIDLRTYNVALKIVLSLVKKQSKEIEELKKPKYIINFETNEITTLTNDFISKEKIKAKIEEYRKIDEEEFVKQGNFETEISVLQSLLEKE